MPLKVFYEVFLGSITIQSLIRKIASSRLCFCSCMAARHIDVPKYVPSCKHESHIYGHLHGSESLQVLISRAQHQFNTVQLINFTCTRVIIDRYDIGTWMTMTKLFDNTLAYDMVWQAGKRLGTYDVWRIIFNQLQHLSSQEPTLTGLISKRYNIRSHGCHMVDIGSRREVRTLLQCFVGRAAEEFQCLDTQAAHAGGHFLLAKILRLKFCVLKAVQQEIHQVRHNCFCTFVLQQVYQTIVGRRREFYKDLAYNTNSRFLLISYQNNSSTIC